MSIKLKVKPIRVGGNQQRLAIINAIHQSVGTLVYWNVNNPFTASDLESCGVISEVSYESDVYGLHPVLTIVPNSIYGPSLETAAPGLLSIVAQFSPEPGKLTVQSVLFTAYQRGEYGRSHPTNAGGYFINRDHRGFYPELCARYREIISESPAIEGVNFSSQHLIWMLDELQSKGEMSLTKKHRWLGFIQGVMVSHGLVTVDDERDLTRDIFKGA